MEVTNWKIDLKDFTPQKFENVRQIINPNYADLRREIMCFNEEIEWDGMWTFEDAKVRLMDGWIFVGFFVDHQIKGWVWLDVNNKLLQNLYVNKSHRNFYNAKKLVITLSSISKSLGYDKIYAEIDGWNKNSHLVATDCGWKRID